MQNSVELENLRAELTADLEAQLQQSANQCEARLGAFHCASVVLAHGAVAGSTMYGGSGLEFQCNAGYNLVGDLTSTCTSAGTWSAPQPVCEVINPCTTDDNDCSADAVCAYTGPGTHSCECANDADGSDDFFGDGSTCTPCSSCPAGWLLDSPCTSSVDTVCLNPCDAVSCGDYGTCTADAGEGTCVCSDGYTGANCEIAPPPPPRWTMPHA